MDVLGFILRVILLKCILKPFLSLFLGVKFRYEEELAFDGPKIIVANHNSHVDAIAILCCVPARYLHKVHPVVARDYFYKNKYTRFFAKLFLNSVSVSRSKEFKNPLNQCEKLLKNGHSLIIFPEGSRGRAGEMQNFRHGVSILLNKYPKTKYLPVYCDGFGDLMPKGDWLLLPFNSSIHFGKSFDINPGGEVAQLTLQIQNQVVSLRPRKTGLAHV